MNALIHTGCSSQAFIGSSDPPPTVHAHKFNKRSLIYKTWQLPSAHTAGAEPSGQFGAEGDPEDAPAPTHGTEPLI